jgi:hypothetical protein
MEAKKLASLQDFGDEGGFLLVGVVDKAWYSRRRLPVVSNRPTTDDPTEIPLGEFVKRTRLGKRSTPAFELGALYYFPAQYAQEGASGKVIQKVCATVDGHNLDNVLIYDEPSGVESEKRKLVLDGSLDAEFLGAIGITANAGAKYLFELELKKPRKREILMKDAYEMRELILNGPVCKDELLPTVSDKQVFQLTAAYYGTMAIKQAYEMEAGADAKGAVPKLKMELHLGVEAERVQLLYFKVFPETVQVATAEKAPSSIKATAGE